MPPTDYPVMFRSMMLRGTKVVLERLQQRSDLPVAEREQALHMLSYALDSAEAWAVASDLLLFLAPRMEQAGHREEWIPYLESGIRQSQQMQDGAAEAALRFHLGMLYQRQARFEEARREYSQSALYFQRMGDREQQARALNRMATVVQRQKQYQEALRLAEQALNLADECVAEQAYSYLVFANVAFDQREWDRAKLFYQRSLDLWRKADDPRMIGWALANLGAALRVLREYEQAIEVYTQAITLLSALNDPVNVAVAQNNLGIVYFHLGQFEQALEWYRKAEPTVRGTQDHGHAARLWVNMGIAHTNLFHWEAAQRCYEASLREYILLGDIRGQANALDGLGLAYHQQGRYAQAIATFQEGLTSLASLSLPPNDPLEQELAQHLREAQEAGER